MSDFSFYYSMGWQHIMTLDALDHLLFIMALSAIYMLKQWKQVLILVTAFTVGHSITLALSTLGWVEVPSGWVEFLIPVTIAFTGISNLLQKSFSKSSIRINYVLALFFGLIHGLAFANILRMILADDQNFAWSMLSFSLGLESGQILVVVFVLLLATLLANLGLGRRQWVIAVSVTAIVLSVQMAWSRWPAMKDRASVVLPEKTLIYIQPVS
jgi:hypothetical protein